MFLLLLQGTHGHGWLNFKTMSKYNHKSSSGAVHPYWNLKKWADGTLCYWRNDVANLYSNDTKQKLEDRLQAMLNASKNLASL